MVAGTAARLGLALGLALLANACQLQVPMPPVKPATSRAPRPADDPPRKASPSPDAPPASAAPSALPSPAASASPAASIARLRVPAGATERLAGAVRLDAGYLVAAGAGNILSQNGALIVAAGGLNLIGADGGSLVGADGGSLVAAGAGNVISPNGAQVLSHNGGQIVAAGGGNVLSHNGGTILSQNGGQAISRYGGQALAPFRLLQAVASPAPGALLPAVGIELRVFELASGRPVAVGVDDAGRSVWAVLTDALGQYDLRLPPALAGNVLVTARVLGHDDPRLVYELVGAPGASAAFANAVDEDSVVAARYLRRAFARKLRAVLDHEGGDEAELVALLMKGTEGSPALAGLAKQVLGDFRARVDAAGVPKDRHAVLADRATDVLVGRLALEDVVVDVTNTAWKGDATEPSLAAMRAVLTRVREAAAAKLAADPAFFDTKSYLVAANEGRPAAERLRVLKAADLGDILVDTFFAGLDATRLQFVTDAFVDLGIPYTEVDHLFAAASGIGLRLGTSFLADEEARQAVFAVVDEVAKAP